MGIGLPKARGPTGQKRVRANENFVKHLKLIWVVQPTCEKYSA
jgi:hypothetical protein